MKRRFAIDLVCVAVAGFIAASLAPRELEFLQRTAIYVLVFGVAVLASRVLDRVLPGRRTSDL